MRLYFGVMAVILIAGAVWLFVRRWLVAANGINVEGRVVAHEKRTSEDSTHYLPVVEFIDQHGKEHRFTSVAGGADPRPAIGETVTVRYLPEQPDRAFIVSFLHMWAAPLGMLALGAGALLGFLKG